MSTIIAQEITVLNQTVNCIDGLFSLNDVHKASGGSVKHQPAFFMRNGETKDLIEEIKHSANLQSESVAKKINGGKNKGTFVCKELVYRYAMWISPRFALLVIRTFDKLSHNVGVAQPKLSDLSTTETRVPLKDAVNKLVATKKINYSDAWKIVHQWVGADKASKMTEADVEKGLRYVHELTISKVLVGELLPKEETPKLSSGHVNISFNMNKDADYTIRVRNGKAQRKQLMYCVDWQDEEQDWWLKA